MTKVAHISTTFNSASALKWTFHLAQDQKQRGWDVEFITGVNASAELIKATEQQGFTVHKIDSLRKYIHPVYDLRALIDLTCLLRQRKFNIVHTHLAKAGIIGRLAAKMAGAEKIIHSVYGATFAPTMPKAKRFFFTSMEKLAARVSDHLVFVGRELRNGYIQKGICEARKSSVIYYSCYDLGPFIKAGAISEEERQARRREVGLEAQDIVLGNVSRLVPWKGHSYALELVRELKKEFPVKMVIVGDAVVPSEQAYKANLLKQVKDLGIENSVIFTGWQKDPSYYFSVFDIYLLTSMPLEGVPGAVIEATVAHVPVVGFECYGVREILGDEVRLVPSKDVRALSYELRRAIAEMPENRPSLRKNLDLIPRLQERHSVERMVREYRELYDRVLSEV